MSDNVERRFETDIYIYIYFLRNSSAPVLVSPSVSSNKRHSTVVPLHAMQTLQRSGSTTPLILNFGTRYGEVRGQLHGPAALPPVQLLGRLDELRSSFGRLAADKIILPLSIIERFLKRSIVSLYITSTNLPILLICLVRLLQVCTIS